jgi:predicted amidohydrolase
MNIAAAQTVPKDRDIEKNMNDHCRLAKLAAKHDVQLIVFPEMSLTGYLREDAADFAFNEHDERLKPLQEISTMHNMSIIAGAPIKLNNKLYIGSFIIQPDSNTLVYTKQFLHEGEEVSFEPSFEYNPQVQLSNEKISVAICADINHAEHAAYAKAQGATLYVAGIFYSPEGIRERGHKLLGQYAVIHNMNVLMANYGAASYGLEAGGKSAYWDNQGNKIAEAEAIGENLLIISRIENKTEGKLIIINNN